ncbi:hypothetical protein BTHERMOSOX_1082 [Bathymodiolus thermophilus thioautotrophic gill symbiont]|nr:hypothetical protein THERMOT_903 [Bathymodiolus thermophilus thioautotrophic gill symbiont]SHA32071.1 hypothetical protein BTHERMOSOX_1082 [Bathymodiolus thermophilus thioautotrophic gill symbiont]
MKTKYLSIFPNQKNRQYFFYTPCFVIPSVAEKPLLIAQGFF